MRFDVFVPNSLCRMIHIFRGTQRWYLLGRCRTNCVLVWGDRRSESGSQKGSYSLIDLSTDGRVVVIHVSSTTASVMSAVTIHGAHKRCTYQQMTLTVTCVSGFNLIGN